MTTRARSRPPTRPGAILDPTLVFAVACALFALHGMQGPLDRDLGVFLYGGERLTHGVPSYVGIFNSVGPLSDTVPGLAMLAGGLVGVEPILAARLLYLGLSAGCCAALYVLARRTFGTRSAGFVAAAVLASAASFADFATGGPREKTLMLLFVLLALIWLLDRRWFLAGIATAIAALTWQPSFVVAVAGLVAAVALEPGGRLRAIGRYVAGGLVPTAVAAAAFSAAGALGPAVDGFVVINAGYTRQPSLLSDPSLVAWLAWDGYSWTLVPFLVGLVALPLLLAAGRRHVGARRGRRSLRVLVAAELASLGWLLVAMNGPADLFDVLPFGALGIAGVVTVVAALLPPRSRLVVVAACLVAAMTATAAVAVGTRSDELVAQRVVVRSVVDQLPPGSTVLSVNAPDALVLADRTNPTPWQVFNGSEDRYLNAHLPGGLPAYADWVRRTRPALIVLGDRNPEDWLRGVLKDGYARLGTTGRWHWYGSTTLGAPRLELLRWTIAADHDLLHSSGAATTGST